MQFDRVSGTAKSSENQFQSGVPVNLSRFYFFYFVAHNLVNIRSHGSLSCKYLCFYNTELLWQKA